MQLRGMESGHEGRGSGLKRDKARRAISPHQYFAGPVSMRSRSEFWPVFGNRQHISRHGSHFRMHGELESVGQQRTNHRNS
jgi:hypothetical protein